MYSFLNMNCTPESVSDEQLAALEQDHNLKLPALLRDFYKRYCGIPIHPVTFTVDGQSFTVTQFIPLFSGSMSADHILDIYRLCGRFPEGYFPLAVSGTGDDYFLDTRTDTIYWVSMDQPHKPVRLIQGLEQFFSLLDAACKGQHPDLPIRR